MTGASAPCSPWTGLMLRFLKPLQTNRGQSPTEAGWCFPSSTSAQVPGIPEARRSGVVRLHPAVLSPGFGRVPGLLLLLLLLSVDVLCIRLDPVALCIAAGVHCCSMRRRTYQTVSNSHKKTRTTFKRFRKDQEVRDYRAGRSQLGESV